MAACFGFWLGRDGSARAEPSPAPARRERAMEPRHEPASRRSLLLPLGVVVAFLVLLELLLRADVINTFIVPLPSRLLAALPSLLLGGGLTARLGLTATETLFASLMITAAAAAFAVLLRRFPTLRATMEGWFAALAAAPVLLVAPASLLIFGLGETAVLAAVVAAGASPAILYLMQRLGGSRASPASPFMGAVFATWLFALPLAFGGVVMVEMLIGRGGLGQAIQESLQRFDETGLYVAIFLAVLIAIGLSAFVPQADADEPTPPARGASAIGPRILIILAVLIGWEILTRSGAANRFVLPPPAGMAQALAEMLASPTFYSDLLRTGYEIVAGSLIGVLGGIAIGWLVRRGRLLQRAIEPLLHYLDLTPKYFLYPIVFLIFGLHPAALISLAALSCFFAIAARLAADANRVPHPVATGLRLGVRAAILNVLLGEATGSNGGLGHRLIESFMMLDVARGYAVLIVAFALAIAIDALVHRFERARDRGLDQERHGVSATNSSGAFSLAPVTAASLMR
jgi:NitT/TauT family transport system permease protein